MEFVFNQNRLSEVWPAPLPEFEVDPSATALLVIDMQLNLVNIDCGFAKLINDSHEKIASYYFPRMKNVVIPNNTKLLELFRESKMRIIFLTLGSELPDGSDKMPRRKKRDSKMDQNSSFKTTFHKGAYEHSIIPELQPLENELVINKNSTGAFNSTAIDQLLRNMGIILNELIKAA